MVDAENAIPSGDLPVLQPLPQTHFFNEKVCSSRKQQEQRKEQVRQRKRKQKIKINSSRGMADKRNESQKQSSGDESEHEYNDRVSLHAHDDCELAGK